MARDPDGTFTCTVASIQAARALLAARGLPLELADMVLERAEYWAVERAETDRVLSVASRPSLADPHRYDPAACPYLQTGPLGRGAGEGGLAGAPFARCRKVVVRVRAKDQGWASEAEAGTYRGAFSWFDASVVRPVEAEGEPSLSPLMTLMAGPFSAEHRNQNQVNWANFYLTTEPHREAHALGRGGWRFVENEADGGVVWLVQRNKVAQRDFLEHTIEWRDDDPEEGEEGEEEEEWAEDGKGNGRGFVASLERGDRIIIWARAMVRRPRC